MVDPGVLTPETIAARVALTTLDGTQGVQVTNLGDIPVIKHDGTPLGLAERVDVIGDSFSAKRTTSDVDTHPTGVVHPTGEHARKFQPTGSQPAQPSGDNQPTDGYIRIARQFSTDKAISVSDSELDPSVYDKESDDYDSDVPEWETEVDRLSAHPIDDLLSACPSNSESPGDVSTSHGHAR